MVLVIQEETNLPENEQFKFIDLNSKQLKEDYRQKLADCMDEAFKDDPRYIKAKVNLFRDFPEEVYFSDRIKIYIIEGDHGVEGFTLLDVVEKDQVHEIATGIVNRGQGNLKQLLENRDRSLKELGITTVVTDVDNDGKYLRDLIKHYTVVERLPLADTNQVTIKYAI